MDCLDIDFDSNLEIFSKQMKSGLAGQKSDLEMIPTYLSAANKIPIGKSVIVVDAGGTNFRVATVIFDQDNKPLIENLERFEMPGVECELSSREFFETMAGYCRNVLEASDQIGFCFSYPVHMLPNKDGRLVRFAKEIKAPEVVGQLIGENLAETIVSMGLGSKKNVVILNDTVATLLAGVGHQNRSFSSYIGFILGTGTNTSYIEKNCNIVKQEGLSPHGTMIINVESGGMGKVHSGKLDAVLDQSTVNPGVHKLEKMTSGAYLGPLSLLIMKQCANDGLLSSETAEALLDLASLESKDLSDFMIYPYGSNPLAMACSNGEGSDAQILYAIADRIVERAGKLTAINLSAMAIESGQGTDPTRPICIVADGTTFHHMKNLQLHARYYLRKHLEEQRGIYTEIIQIDNAPVIGAAIAGLIN
jgi:hexokinase